MSVQVVLLSISLEMWLNPPFPSLWEWPVRIQAPFNLDHVEVLVPKQKLSPSCRVGSISYGSIWYFPACSIYSTLYSVFICFYWDESQASKRQTALIQWWHMPLKTVFLFFFFFFWESRMEAVYSDSCGCLNKRGRWSVGRSFTLPRLYTQMLKEDYILAFCSTFPPEDVSETGSSSESQACLAWHLLTPLAAPHLHITSMGGERGISWYPLPIFILLEQQDAAWKEYEKVLGSHRGMAHAVKMEQQSDSLLIGWKLKSFSG